ncbi:MAG: hypothetical protein LBV39_02920, partial [Bacteroidales bacterium]|nr:hypothetical protein [Bacteroidales bacterium]
MKARILFVFILVATTVTQAQEFKDRLFFGGNFGLMIGDFTDIELSPHVGYYITNRWSAAVGMTYEYYNNKYHFPDYATNRFKRYETSIFGGRLFSNYVIVNNVNDFIPLGLNFRIFAHAEYEALAYPRGFFEEGATGKQTINSVLVGGGLRFPMGRRSSMNLTFLWKLNSNSFLSDI